MKSIFLLTAFFTSAIIASAQSDKSANRLAQYNLSDKTLAIEGYDPVSYFFGSPKKGSNQYTVQHQDLKCRFAHAITKKLF